MGNSCNAADIGWVVITCKTNARSHFLGVVGTKYYSNRIPGPQGKKGIETSPNRAARQFDGDELLRHSAHFQSECNLSVSAYTWTGWAHDSRPLAHPNIADSSSCGITQQLPCMQQAHRRQYLGYHYI
eukprot:814486-Amphidinium_carterae.1